MRCYPLEKLINLHDSYSGLFKIDNRDLLLIQRKGERYLVEDEYCCRPGCPCNDALVRFLKLNEETEDGPSPGILVNPQASSQRQRTDCAKWRNQERMTIDRSGHRA